MKFWNFASLLFVWLSGFCFCAGSLLFTAVCIGVSLILDRLYHRLHSEKPQETK